jgi:cytoskeletal protein CcmA (bactofilin family)
MNLRIKGELTAEEDLTIDGSFEGAIDLHRHHLTTTAGSEVKARVSARAVTVLGRLEGHITADAVDIRPTAVVEANLVTKQFALEEGGRFNGQVNTERARAAGDILRHRAAGKDAAKGLPAEAPKPVHSQATGNTEVTKKSDKDLIPK